MYLSLSSTADEAFGEGGHFSENGPHRLIGSEAIRGGLVVRGVGFF